MKKTFLILSALLVLNLAWMGFVRKPLAPVPEICGTISAKVPLQFSIHSMDYSNIELGLNQKIQGKGMFIHFAMDNAWKTGRTGLVIKGINANPNFQGGMSAKKYLADEKRQKPGGKDFSPFLKSRSGSPISSYAFQQQLVEGEKGETFMHIQYEGSAAEMLQTLTVARPLTLPAHISRQFVDKGTIQFQPGTFTYDTKSRGFYIPVKAP